MNMDRRRRRLIAYVGSIVIIVFVYGFVYYWGMRLFEHRPRSFLHSLQVVIQTFTTVGFGGDAPWQSPTMKILMIMMEVTGIFLVFLALPLFVVPALEDRLTVTPPTSIDENNHVIICGFGTRGEMLVDELESVGVRYVIIEQDRDSAKDLYEQGYSVMHGDPESISALEDADIESATAIVLNNGDESNAAIALAVRERDPDIQTVCYLEDPQFQDYLEYAGVDTILLPHQMIGESLAEKVTSSITARLGDTIKVGEDFQVVEMPVQQESTLEGMSLRESNIRKRTGADIIGIWKGDNFIINPSPNEIITKKSTLLATGTEQQLSKLKNLTLSDERSHHRDHVIIAGYGEVGSTLQNHIQKENIETTVVDKEDKPGVDVVGDITEPETLKQANISDVSAFIPTLKDDTVTILSILVVRNLAPEIQIICKAERNENVSKMYNAGADTVLALAAISGRMLASAILEEDIISLGQQIEIIRMEAPQFAGQNLAESNIREETGCTVVAVERNGEIISDLRGDFAFQSDDKLIIAGTDSDIAKFHEYINYESRK